MYAYADYADVKQAPVRRGHKGLCGVVVACVLLLLSARADGDPAPICIEALTGTGVPTPHLKLTSPMTLARDDGRTRRLPVGRFVDEPSWSLLDAEMKRLQDTETRLTAENTSLRKSTSGWQPGWKTLGSVLITGIALGAFVATR